MLDKIVCQTYLVNSILGQGCLNYAAKDFLRPIIVRAILYVKINVQEKDGDR